ncbi:heme-binding domain-containing protein [Aequorivita echinoideorum]|uniref:Heme-binding domain-containing protein n=1 Tax=Aequorivita echinoideorum TaxID=1549647 RepID=A0ABS5S9K2_9FLAO|nr:heme-binding domain-containing protein [Aequorivita echinoideorum]MBT0609027.1 heme-binding domain-containing protein [Aequorivita echinoideorum]
MKIFRPLLIFLLISFIIIQFIRPERNNGGYNSIQSFEAETKPSAQVSAILRENCYDCHSNQTQYPWYAEIAPISFWLADHIAEGKEHFNVSEWKSYSLKKKEHKLEELVEEVENGEMPLQSYTIIHGNLSPENTTLLLQWAGVARLQYRNQLQVSSR